MRKAIEAILVPPADARRLVDFSLNPPPGWPEERRAEMIANTRNGVVGSVLVSETDRLRVWHIMLEPGQRMPFHRHVLDYFWTTVEGGRARSYMETGEIKESVFAAGLTSHFHYAAGEAAIHDLENIGDTRMSWVTVEFLDSQNTPLPLPPAVRSQTQSGAPS